MALYKQDYARDAVMINGQFLEDLIPGHFYTLTSTGRETLEREINSTTYRRNGAINDFNRYIERTITISYIIDGDDADYFRENYNHLMALLDQEDADIQFNDEIDKYYKGTISVKATDEKYGTWALGTYEIVCEDPFKYSVNTISEEPDDITNNEATFNINYKGSQPAHPILRASFGSGVSSGEYTDADDCGFIAFFDSNGHIIQLGNPDAENLDASSKAGILYSANTDNISINDFYNKWSNVGTGGVLKRNMVDINFNKGAGWSHKLIAPEWGSSTASENGPQMRLTTASTFQNFNMNFVARIMSLNTTTDRGHLYLGAFTDDDKFTGVSIMKTDSSATAVVAYWVDSIIRGSNRIPIDQYNHHFGFTKKTPVYKTTLGQTYPNTVNKDNNGFIQCKIENNGYSYTSVNGNICIKKMGNSFIFKVGNLAAFTYTYKRANNSIMTFDRLRCDFIRKNGFTAMDMGVQSFMCWSLPGAHFTEQKNIFQAGDTIEADTSSAQIQIYGPASIEGQLHPEYGALGNDWEEFVLTPGNNTIKAVWSDWAVTNPDVKILYNEVYV